MWISTSHNRPMTLFQSSFGVRLCGVAFAVTFVAGSVAASANGQPGDNGNKVSLQELVANLRKENELVGLAAMVMVDGKFMDAAVDGERKHESGVALEVGDRWHLGSITKSITATMIARLVEAGQMRWTDTVGDCFSDAAVHEDWKPVTLRQLLTHTAGAPPNFSVWVKLQHPEVGVKRTQARLKAVLDVVAVKPASLPGSTFAYSNVGYTIAGAMADKAAGLTWEELVRQEVFEPLKLKGAGFGPPKSSDEKLEQPRGHVPFLFGSKLAQKDDADNTPIVGPAGTVHMTLSDLCKYATEHMRGDLAASKLLSAETYKLLHAPELEQYACGWMEKNLPTSVPDKLYWHNGSNTMWYALVVFIPKTKMVIAVTCNEGDIEKAESAAWEVVGAYVPTGVYSKRSPFKAVRWQESGPEVKLGDDWFKLVSLDGRPIAEIMDFSQRTFGKRWQMRFEEDLVELLTRMGLPPQETVTLVIESLETGKESTRKDVPMTEENRRAIKAAARKREVKRESPATVP